jgi:hypothetical protein
MKNTEGTNKVYKRTRPHLTIEITGGGSLGNCYSQTNWRVTSWNRISKEKLVSMNNIGLLGIGQEFYVSSQADGKEPAAGHDETPCQVVDRRTGKVLDEPPINDYSGKPIEPIQCEFYVYDCESRCDSGD